MYLNINRESQINIRTFSHRFADPISGRYQNNQFRVGEFFINLNDLIPISAEHPRTFIGVEEVRRYLERELIENRYLSLINDSELRDFLVRKFREEDRELRKR